MKPTVTIRALEPGDVPAVVDIIGAHDADDGQCARRYYEDYLGDQDRRASEREQNFVAVLDDGTIAGVCGFGPDKYDLKNVLWLSWFYVAGANQGRGVGRQLLQHTLALAETLEIDRVYLDTSSDPGYERAIAMYQKAGFTSQGVLKNYYGNGESMIIMGLDLRGGRGGE